jgi:hypothetical protein
MCFADPLIAGSEPRIGAHRLRALPRIPHQARIERLRGELVRITRCKHTAFTNSVGATTK